MTRRETRSIQRLNHCEQPLRKTHPTRRSQSANTRRYDRIARFYSTLEPLYLIFPPARRRAVAALGLKPGDTVLEIGAGTGRNFPYLVEAVGPSGTVIGVDASPGMLAEARKLIERRRLVECPAAPARRHSARSRP